MHTTSSDSREPEPDRQPGAAAAGEATDTSNGFFDWLRNLGITRTGDRWLAGVAGGVAGRAGIDPIIVRGMFVVFAVLGGPGLILYFAGWLLLPGTHGRIQLEEIIRGRAESWVVAVGVTVAAIFAIPVLFGVTAFPFGGVMQWGAWGLPEWVRTLFTVLWWTAIAGGLVWFFSWVSTRSSADSTPAGASRPADPDSSPRRAEEWGENLGEKAAAFGDRVGAQANEWGEQLNHRAGEWSDRCEAAFRARALGAGYVLMTVAFALLAGGAAALWTFSGGGVAAPDLDPTHLAFILGVVAAVAVLALSMIIAGARGKNSGWVGFFASLGVVTLLFSAVIPQGTAFRPFGTDTFTLESDPAGVSVIAGSTHLDLTTLDTRARGDLDPSQPEAAVWIFAGSSRITLPEDRPVILDIGLLAGNIKVRTPEGDVLRSSGPLLNREVRVNMPSGDVADVERITVRVAFGNVQVRGADDTEIDNLWEREA